MAESTTPSAGPETQPAVSAAAAEEDRPTGKAEALRVIGGLIAVGMGLLVVFLFGAGALTVYAIKGKLGTGLVSIVTSAFGVIGSIVGAYFGLKIGTDQAKDASAAAQAAEAKSDVFAAYVPDTRADAATQAANAVAAA